MTKILQTIWIALTTQNERLTTLIGIPSMFLEIFVSMLLFTTLLNIDATKKQKFIYVIVVSILGILSRLFIPNPFNVLINLVVMFLAIKFIFKTTILRSVSCLIIPFTIEILLESIFSKIYFSILNINYIDATNIPIHRFSISIIIYGIEYLIYLLIKYLKVNLFRFEILDKKKKNLLICNAILGVILICCQLYTTYFYSSVLPFYIVLLNLIGLITFILLSFYTLLTIAKLESTSMNLEEAKLYNKTLQMLQDNTRAFKHDFSNIVQGMAGFIDKNDMEGLKKYYSQLLEDIQHTNNLTTLSPEVVNNPAIYNVLATKYHKADQLGIKINLEAFLNMNDLHIKIYEFTRVLGILMDNAIEASKECDEKIINVVFRKDSRRHMQLLIIENTYTNKDVNTDKIFEKCYSTKQGNTGLGLWEVRQILKKNNNLNLFTTKNDEFFTQQFEIFY